jgi:hypothetical protein
MMMNPERTANTQNCAACKSAVDTLATVDGERVEVGLRAVRVVELGPIPSRLADVDGECGTTVNRIAEQR